LIGRMPDISQQNFILSSAIHDIAGYRFISVVLTIY
jgi:hypothetical protein